MTPRSLIVVTLLAVLPGACSRPQQPSAPAAQPASLTWIGPAPGSAIATLPVTNPYSGDRSAIAEGFRYFNSYNCSGCHGDHGGGGMGPSLRDSLWYYGGSDAAVFSSIYQGRDKGMPAWGTKLSPEQIWKITSYIKSMRTANEANPPH